jgi:enoyl-CoA hydratase
MELENLLYDVKDGKATITLNRPEKLNALSGPLLRDLNEALWEADNNSAVHVVILQGAGRAFSAGYDISVPYTDRTTDGADYRGMRTLDDDAWQLERSQRLRMALWDMHKPVIAKIHGYCLAGGTDIALLCDIIIAADDCLIGFPPVRAQGGPPNHMWLYNVGPQWAKRLLMTGDSITGADAASIGLVLQAVPADDLDDAVDELANKMAMIDHESLAAQKRIVNLGLELMGARTLQRLAAEMDARAHQSPSVAEFNRISGDQGLKSALEWRDSKFGDGRASTEYQQRKQAQQERNR